MGAGAGAGVVVVVVVVVAMPTVTSPVWTNDPIPNEFTAATWNE